MVKERSPSRFGMKHPTAVSVSYTLARSVALLVAADALRSLPVIVFAFLQLLATFCIFSVLTRKLHFRRDLHVRVAINGAFHALLVVLYSKGLQECGALRATLLDFAGVCVANFVSMVYGKKRDVDANVRRLRVKADIVVGVGYLLLLYHSPVEGEEDENVILDEVGLAWGVVLLLAASLLQAVQQRFSHKIIKEVKVSVSMLNALSYAAATVLLSPLVVLDFIGEAVIGADYDYSVISGSTLAAICTVAWFIPVAGAYVGDIMKAQDRSSVNMLRIYSLVLSFPFALICVDLFGLPGGHKDSEATRFHLFLCYLTTAAGISIPIASQMVNEADFVAAASPSNHWRQGLPLKVARALVGCVSIFTVDKSSYVLPLKKSDKLTSRRLWQQSKKMLSDILKTDDSKKIFVFLCLNFAFMFVEIFMGFWTNSLGLISDAGHMFFDCAALFVGLVASVISRWQPDATYSYGYSRIQVVSGFVNAIFLVFIAVFVFTESLERIAKPPELNDSGLMLTSVGGFCVNMVGLVFFHEHAHASSGDHSNCAHNHGSAKKAKPSSAVHTSTTTTEDHSSCSHGGDHGHSHNTGHAHHEGEAAKPCEHGHDHGHSHAHDHSHSHAHGSHSLEAETVAKVASVQPAHQHGGHEDANMRGVFLHILADLLGSVGVVISSLLIKYRGWYIADPICSLMISVLILVSVVPLLQSTTEDLLLKVPKAKGQEFNHCLSEIHAHQHVTEILQPHFWRNSSTSYHASLWVVVDSQEHQHEVLLLARQSMDKLTATASVIQVTCQSTIGQLTELKQHCKAGAILDATAWDPYSSGLNVRRQ